MGNLVVTAAFVAGMHMAGSLLMTMNFKIVMANYAALLLLFCTRASMWSGLAQRNNSGNFLSRDTRNFQICSLRLSYVTGLDMHLMQTETHSSEANHVINT
jgi:hypothetical protein